MAVVHDVAVVGGGPAGSTIGTLLARRGHDVVILEKEHHPRFHIGESLLPLNLPILHDLGVLEEVDRIGVVKRGADFSAGVDAGFVSFRFSRALRRCPSFAYEVRRSEFDEILFSNAGRHGAELCPGTTAQSIERDENGVFEVRTRLADGSDATRRARFIVDASGRDCLLAGTLNWKQRNREHATAAVFTHYRSVRRRLGEDAGNISIYWFESGWIWMIPLRDDVMSVGAVCRPEYLRTRKTDRNDFLEQTLRLCPEAWERMENAQRLQPVQATGNYSYRSREVGGSGFLLVGDAYAFVDPVFSSGVYVAMSSATRAVDVVEYALAGRALRHRLARWRYRRQTDKAIRTFSWFIYRFTSPVMRDLFRSPRNVLGAEQAVISMLAGDVYLGGTVRLRLMVFRMIFSVSSILRWQTAWAHRRARLRSAREGG